MEHLSSQSSQTKNRQLTTIDEEVVLSHPDSAALGTLMNTRGLMELEVLNVGLDFGVLSRTLFAMFVLMAIVTTLATTPILQTLVAPRGSVVPE